jgi:hypothetical protein
MAEYFDTTMKPRIQKAIYSNDWENGKPVSRYSGVSHIFKYVKLDARDTFIRLNQIVTKFGSDDIRYVFVLSDSIDLLFGEIPGLALRRRDDVTGGLCSGFPLILQNIHRYFFYLALPFPIILFSDGVRAFFFPDGFGLGLGTLILLANAVLLGAYTISCHSCRSIIGGKLNHFSRLPVRYKMWGLVSKLNGRHMLLAWASLIASESSLSDNSAAVP